MTLDLEVLETGELELLDRDAEELTLLDLEEEELALLVLAVEELTLLLFEDEALPEPLLPPPITTAPCQIAPQPPFEAGSVRDLQKHLLEFGDQIPPCVPLMEPQ